MPKVLLFDLGGVLIENATFQELPNLISGTDSAASLQDRWLESRAVQRFERGEIDSAEFAGSFVSEWSLKIAPAEFLHIFSEWPRGPYPGALEFLSRLRKRYTIAYLSNCNSIHWKQLDEILRYADRAFSSHLYGLVKPDREIFVRVAHDLGCEPSQICFFDDSLTNVMAAKQAGMSAYRAVGFDNLEQIVDGLGL